jgi:hypothetical protein
MYSQLSNRDLDQLLLKKVRLEREVLSEIILLLEEVDRRKLYLDRAYGSLIEFCLKALGYSESAAYRRVQAMRIAREIPEIGVALSNGKLNLVNVAKAQAAFAAQEQKGEAFSKDDKCELLKKIEGKSQAQAETVIAEITGAPVPVDRVRRLGHGKVELRLVVSESLIEKLNKLRVIKSHKLGLRSYSEVIEEIAELASKQRAGAGAGGACRKPAPQRRTSGSAVNSAPGTRRKHIANSTRRETWQNAEEKCEFHDPITGKRCGSRFQLEIDHRIPYAKGGGDESANLRLLCRAHNQHLARRHFGSEKMRGFTSSRMAADFNGQ